MTTLLILATGNQDKARELRAMLPRDVDVVTATELGVELPEETGATFAENAALKAVAISRLRAGLVLADDSGLEVDALDGRPGVRSARYAGEPSDDAANLALLLSEIGSTPDALRGAHFACALCLARDGVVLAEVTGTCAGRIASAPKGTSGFGYDPVFVIDDGRTMAELTSEEKNTISHRGRALRLMAPTIVRLARAE